MIVPMRVYHMAVLCLGAILVSVSMAPSHATEPLQTVAPAPLTSPFAKGPLRELDRARKSVVIETKSGLHTFYLTDRTFVHRGTEKLPFDALQPGQIMAVRFVTDESGRKVVSHAKVYAPPESVASGSSTNQTATEPNEPSPPDAQP